MAVKPRSEKIKVLEYLYDKLTAEGRTVAMLTDVQEAIVTCNEKFELSLSTSNPANFMKDLVRGKNASRNWPESLKAKRIGGRQRVGGGRALEFVPYGPNQTDAFENSFERSEDLHPIPLQSISLPLTAKRLGRGDESWLVQVAVALRVVEQHLAIRKADNLPEVLEVTHLQTGVKLGRSEVDALFLATCEIEGGKRVSALITCEAKQERERIVGHQIVGQVVAANRSVKLAGIGIDLIIPIAIQALDEPPGCIYLAEFEPWLCGSIVISTTGSRARFAAFLSRHLSQRPKPNIASETMIAIAEAPLAHQSTPGLPPPLVTCAITAVAVNANQTSRQTRVMDCLPMLEGTRFGARLRRVDYPDNHLFARLSTPPIAW